MKFSKALAPGKHENALLVKSPEPSVALRPFELKYHTLRSLQLREAQSITVAASKGRSQYDCGISVVIISSGRGSWIRSKHANVQEKAGVKSSAQRKNAPGQSSFHVLMLSALAVWNKYAAPVCPP